MFSSTDWTASVEIPASSTSVPAISKLALNPALTPAKPTAMPARGWRPMLRKTMPAKGEMMMVAASEAQLPIIPAKTTA